ncbi:MAG: hypothetical protein RIG82_08240 [Phycisphaeraceae bacterium]
MGNVEDGLIAAVREENDEHPMAVWVGWPDAVAKDRVVVVWVDGELASWRVGQRVLVIVDSGCSWIGR